MSEPVICFGQQPCGFFPKRFFFAKVVTALRLRGRIGGRVVWFCHDSDDDHRETTTPLVDRLTGRVKRLNFDHVSRTQKSYSPLYIKRIEDGWQERTVRVLPNFVSQELTDLFASVRAQTVADFCIDMYRATGLLEGIDVVRSSDPEVRRRAIDIEEPYVDVEYEGEVVRARRTGGRLRLHRGGGLFIDLPDRKTGKERISPARDARLLWMQSVVRCTHYVAGASEMQYMDRTETPEVVFLERDVIDDPHGSFVEGPFPEGVAGLSDL